LCYPKENQIENMKNEENKDSQGSENMFEYTQNVYRENPNQVLKTVNSDYIDEFAFHIKNICNINLTDESTYQSLLDEISSLNFNFKDCIKYFRDRKKFKST
jgi:hypothetical protein